ncbi:MAG: sigma-70 family RNA polymerase sigma factor [Acidobacteriota bacterium]|nr:MAG: sigma-70 family RNA polymerase sigma factor [Acidobacteriota bacterium]
MPGDNNVIESVDHLFRRHAGQMTAVLTRIFGFGKIDLIEDAIQESMLRALSHWSYKGLPDNPRAWLIQVAKNNILDRLRKSSRDADLEEESKLLDAWARSAGSNIDAAFEKEIREDQLQMIFACCHPALTPDSRIALTLKTVGGFSVTEIATAFLSNKEAVAKMLVRAKKKLRDEGARMEIPVPSELRPRLESVLKVLYLMFNEGYSASGGEIAVRTDLCHEAIRLAKLLADHPLTSQPKVHALAALFLFQASRLPARSGEGGTLIVLPDQDRTLWNREMIGDGLRHFRASASGGEISDYHIEAEIASYHAVSEDYGSTDWNSLLDAYDRLMAVRPSPIAALNRIIALAEVEGEDKALNELQSLADEKLEAYYPYHVTLAELQRRTGRREEALRSYEFAAGLVENAATRCFIEEKIEGIRSRGSLEEHSL